MKVQVYRYTRMQIESVYECKLRMYMSASWECIWVQVKSVYECMFRVWKSAKLKYRNAQVRVSRRVSRSADRATSWVTITRYYSTVCFRTPSLHLHRSTGSCYLEIESQGKCLPNELGWFRKWPTSDFFRVKTRPAEPKPRPGHGPGRNSRDISDDERLSLSSEGAAS